MTDNRRHLTHFSPDESNNFTNSHRFRSLKELIIVYIYRSRINWIIALSSYSCKFQKKKEHKKQTNKQKQSKQNQK